MDFSSLDFCRSELIDYIYNMIAIYESSAEEYLKSSKTLLYDYVCECIHKLRTIVNILLEV